jgi:hypothetical protein
MSPRWGSTPRRTDRQTVGRNVTLTFISSSFSARQIVSHPACSLSSSTIKSAKRHLSRLRGIESEKGLVALLNCLPKNVYIQIIPIVQDFFGKVYNHSLTNSMELSPSWEATNRSATQEFSNIGSLSCSQELATGPYPEPDRSSPYHPIPVLQDPS